MFLFARLAKSFTCGAVLAAALSLIAAHTKADPQPQVRMKWQDFVKGPDGTKRLASLQRAITKMKSLDASPPGSADFRRSWTYWASIHGYLGSRSHFGTVAQQTAYLQQHDLSQFVPRLVGAPGEPGFKDQSPPDDIARAVWATCQHSPRGQQLDFFGWHRMYLYYFERVLRWAADDPTLTLPYWDYTDPAQTAVPKEFRDKASTLYDWRRADVLNDGSSAIDPQLTDIDDPLTGDPDYLAYEGDIETGVHGNVHCTVGTQCPVAVMGLVGLAANDPIFYTHHANIDRMWSCWQHAHPDEAAGDWQNDRFSFVDETGAKVTRPVKDVLKTAALGYVYDNESSCTRSATVAVAASERPRTEVAQADQPQRESTAVASPPQPIALNPTTTAVTVTIAKPKLQEMAAAPSSRTSLVLSDVSSQFDPGALVGVFVAPKDKPEARVRVGTINWFGVFDHAAAGEHEGHAAARTFRYDITRHVKAMGLADSGEVTVTLEATSGLVPTGANAAASHTAAAPPRATLRPDAKVTVGAIEVR